MATSKIGIPNITEQTTATFSSKIDNTELAIRRTEKVVQGHFIFRVKETLQNFDVLASGLPTNSLRKQTIASCVAGSQAGKSTRFAIHNGSITVFYSGVPLNVGDTWCVAVDYISD